MKLSELNPKIYVWVIISFALSTLFIWFFLTTHSLLELRCQLFTYCGFIAGVMYTLIFLPPYKKENKNV